MNTEELKKLYSEADIHAVRVAEEARLPGKSRVEEIRNLARLSGIKCIDIANCIGLQKEANKLKKVPKDEFENIIYLLIAKV
jgi:uncharacterized metal-binding protein